MVGRAVTSAPNSRRRLGQPSPLSLDKVGLLDAEEARLPAGAAGETADAPVRRHRGSAIFWHGARDGFTPTAGCVAIRIPDFAKILPRLSRDAVMVIR